MPIFRESFSTKPPQGSLNDELLVREIITRSIKQCSKSREVIAEEMSSSLDLAVTARMISSFTSKSKELHRWPGAWDRAFCAAVGSNDLLFCRVQRAGFKVIDQGEADLLELGREYLRQKQAAENIALLEQKLRGGKL